MKKNNWTWIILSLIVIGGLIFIFGDNILQQTVPVSSAVGSCSGGFTTFSIDKVTINSDKSRIRVYGVAKGSECLNIQLSPSQLNSYLQGQGVQATESVTGSIKLLEYTKTFPIDKTGQNFLTIESINKGFKAPFTCTLNYCKSSVSSNSIGSFRSGTFKTDCNCVYNGISGIAGDFSNSRSYGNFKVEFNIDGQTTYLTREQQSVNLGNHHIEWAGSLMNLDEIYAPQYDARLIGSKWDLVRDGAISDMNSALSTFGKCASGTNPTSLQNLFTEVFIESSRISSCKSSYDSSFNSIVQSKLSSYKLANSNLIYDANTDLNNLYVSLKATPYPAFILDLDASDVGIIALEGKPQITSCIPNQNDLKSGQNKIVSLSVKNNADADNVEFYGSISCNQGVTAFIPNFNIGSYQTKTITAELNTVNPNQNDLNFNCQVTIRDVKSGSSDSCSFSGKVIYESGIICEPDSLTCDSTFSNVLKCTADGKNKVLFKECKYGCEIENGQGTCREEEPTQDELKCESCSDWALNIFRSADKECESQSVIETKWYNPVTWVGYTGITGMNIVCPIFFIILVAIVILIILVLLIISALFRKGRTK